MRREFLQQTSVPAQPGHPFANQQRRAVRPCHSDLHPIACQSPLTVIMYLKQSQHAALHLVAQVSNLQALGAHSAHTLARPVPWDKTDTKTSPEGHANISTNRWRSLLLGYIVSMWALGHSQQE